MSELSREERHQMAVTLWQAITRLMPVKSHAALDGLHESIEALYGHHATPLESEGYARGYAAALETLEAAKADAYRSGMLAVQRRADFRDPYDVQDAEELRSTH